MNRSLDVAIEGARARAVPWGEERAARVLRGIAPGRSRIETAAARFTLGGVASAALLASVVLVSNAIRSGSPSEHRLAATTPVVDAAESKPLSVAEPEAEFAERPLGDGGYEATIE